MNDATERLLRELTEELFGPHQANDVYRRFAPLARDILRHGSPRHDEPVLPDFWGGVWRIYDAD